MNLLKIISIFFIIYFIRRFIQAYKVMRHIQEENERLVRAQAQANSQQARSQTQQQHQSQSHPQSGDDVINADFRVID